MKYYYEIQVNCPDEATEVLMAVFSEKGFESFLEQDYGFDTYAEEEQFNPALLDGLKDQFPDWSISFDIQRLEEKNWNEDWESNYEAILVDDRCYIRASFHEPGNYPFEIVINPKMSFGTGHHATTYLMVKAQLAIDHRHKRVLDVGAGTSVLSILALKLGAKEVVASEVSSWALENSEENFQLNNCSNYTLLNGPIATAPPEGSFELVLANINRNVLLEEVPLYVQYMAKGAQLWISGFYEQNWPEIKACAEAAGLELIAKDSRNEWVCAGFSLN